jgi:hypothetical protein
MAINVNIDLSPVAGLIGTADAADEMANDERYVEDLIAAAHVVAAQEFDLEAIAYAQAGGNIRHMFEWGTQGINRGRTTRRMNPNNPLAKLWKHNLVGNGKNQAADFDFQESTVPVPPPTVERSGVGTQYLRQMKKGKAVFWHKARIMESGAEVTISPKTAKGLFIPFRNDPPEGASPSAIKRGFMIYPGTVTTHPGKGVAGTFTAFWTRFWEGRGEEIMQSQVEENFRKDVEAVMAKTETAGTRVKPVRATNFETQVKASKARATSAMRARANARNKKVD